MNPRITAIGSGKGGTGKTLIAVSLAHALSHQNERVLLCDADLGLSNAGVHLGIKEGGIAIADNENFLKVVPADVRAKIKALEQQILSGKIKVGTAFGQ